MEQPLHTPDTPSITDYKHTRKTLQVETGSTPKTIRSWIKKAGVTGTTFENVERFNDEQRLQILSQRRKPAEVIEAELVEPGAIELHTSQVSTAAPLVRFDLPELQLSAPGADTSALDAHTEQLAGVVGQSADVIVSALTDRFKAGVSQIIAEQDNLLQGIRAQALNGAAQSLSKGGK